MRALCLYQMSNSPGIMRALCIYQMLKCMEAKLEKTESVEYILVLHVYSGRDAEIEYLRCQNADKGNGQRRCYKSIRSCKINKTIQNRRFLTSRVFE
jgi:hypothetical protein